MEKERKKLFKKMKPEGSKPGDEHPPNSLAQALLRVLWDLSPKLRWAILLIVGCLAGIFVFWTSLPPSLKEQVAKKLFGSNPTINSSKSKEIIGAKHEELSASSILLKELKDNNLIQKLLDADAYLAAGSIDSKEKSLKIYHDILSQLSADASGELDPNLLSSARSDDREGHIDNALAKYKELFKNVLKKR